MDKYLSFDMGGTEIKYALVSEDFKIIEKYRFPTNFKGVDAVVNKVMKIAQPYLSGIQGIGFSMPGTILDDENGTILRGGSLTFMEGIAFGRIMEEKTGLPCAVENDGKSCAYGEYACGTLSGKTCGVVMAIGTAVAGGILINGKVHRGLNHFAGEFSYLIDQPEDLGTWDAFLAFKGGVGGLQDLIIKEKNLSTETKLDGFQIFKLIHSGDKDAIKALHTFARRLGIHILNLQSVLDPEIFAIGGGISREKIFIDTINEEIQDLMKLCILRPTAPIVVQSRNGNDANIIGAVFKCKEKIKNRRIMNENV